MGCGAHKRSGADAPCARDIAGVIEGLRWDSKLWPATCSAIAQVEQLHRQETCLQRADDVAFLGAFRRVAFGVMKQSRMLRRRRLVSCVAAAGLASGLVVPVMITHPHVALATVTVAPDEVTASADAEAQSDRTNYTQVFANPDGTFSYNAASAAQRTQNADGTWSNLDPTLALQSDGTVRSAASQTGLVLSGGGSGPLVTMSQGSASLTIASPVGALPAPTLSGATATYASLLPGVDLQVTARPRASWRRWWSTRRPRPRTRRC